jgi:hypothetical protein
MKAKILLTAKYAEHAEKEKADDPLLFFGFCLLPYSAWFAVKFFFPAFV